MDSTDASGSTAGVQALLESLRSSQAWQQTINLGTTISDTASRDSNNLKEDGANVPEVAELSASDRTVASLLSQLKAASEMSPSDNSKTSYPPPVSEPSARPPRPSNLRSCTFQQALSRIVQLSQDDNVVGALQNMKQEQVQLETRLWEERQAIHRRHEEKVKVARTKASLIGAGMTQFEADSMTEAFRQELKKFDKERVLPAWDGLLAKQQVALESLGVPAMFGTTVISDLQKQKKIFKVLEEAIE